MHSPGNHYLATLFDNVIVTITCFALCAKMGLTSWRLSNRRRRATSRFICLVRSDATSGGAWQRGVARARGGSVELEDGTRFRVSRILADRLPVPGNLQDAARMWVMRVLVEAGGVVELGRPRSE